MISDVNFLLNSHLGSQDCRKYVANAGDLAVEVILWSQIGPRPGCGCGGHLTAVLSIGQCSPDGAVDESLVIGVDSGAQSDGSCYLLGVLQEQQRCRHGRPADRHRGHL